MTIAILFPHVCQEMKLLEASAPIPASNPVLTVIIKGRIIQSASAQLNIALTDSVFFIVEVIARRFLGSFIS